MAREHQGFRSASRNPLTLWRDHATGRVMGDGQCEWCGLRIYCGRARWFTDEAGYALVCGNSGC